MLHLQYVIFVLFRLCYDPLDLTTAFHALRQEHEQCPGKLLHEIEQVTHEQKENQKLRTQMEQFKEHLNESQNDVLKVYITHSVRCTLKL